MGLPRHKGNHTVIASFQIGFHSLADIERYFTLRVLEYYEGDRRNTAIALGISRKTLYNRLKEYNQAEYKLHPKYKKMIEERRNDSQH